MEVTASSRVYGSYGYHVDRNSTLAVGERLKLNVSEKEEASSYGVVATSSSKVTLGKQAEINSSAEQGDAFGFTVSSSTITTGDETKITASSDKGSAYAMYIGNSNVALGAGAVINSKAEQAGNAYGAYVFDDSSGTLGDNATIHSSSGQGSAFGLAASDAEIVAKGSVHVRAASESGGAVGVIALELGQINLEGGSIHATIGQDQLGTAIAARKSSGVNAESARYDILGNLVSSGDGQIIIGFDQGSVFTGATQYDQDKGGVLGLLMLDATDWNMTGDSSLSNLHFENAGSQVDFMGKGARPGNYMTLNIGELSGTGGQFNMRTSIAGQQGDYINIGTGSGKHNLNVSDSGVEITDPINTSLDLITDASRGAEFILTTLDGTKINAIDGGTYMYFLNDRDTKDDEKNLVLKRQ